MNSRPKRFLFCCNGASPRRGAHILEYRQEVVSRNIIAGLPKFVQDVVHLSDRTLDLLEIATYVFCADRSASRGRRDSVEYHAWSRIMEFRIRVREPEFWNKAEVKSALTSAIKFMSGDAEINFTFLPGHSTPPTSLFDREEFKIDDVNLPRAISLFSGGIDSLAGAIELLGSRKQTLLVSHESQTGTIHTQRVLFEALKEHFPGKASHYKFKASLRGSRASDETQRTRALLYCSIAYALAEAYNLREFYVYENGVTSINLYRREDLANARASRTTHPRTMYLMGRLFSLMRERTFTIQLPYLLLTKREVIEKILKGPLPSLLSSAVSCTHAFREESTTHCGMCFQCIDRRIAAFAADATDDDHVGLYGHDIVTEDLENPGARTVAIDYVRQAARFDKWGSARFEEEYASELAQLADSVPNLTDDQMVEAIWGLMKRHGSNVASGIRAMRERFDDPFSPLSEHSLLGIVAQREHLRPEVLRLVETIGLVVMTAVPEMFRVNKPANEPDFNGKVGALLRTHDSNIRSEHPTLSFACAKIIPDHLLQGNDLLIESKFIRKGTPPSKVSEGMAGDLVKYPQKAHILFLVYDPDHAIQGDDIFVNDFESRGRCNVKILR